VQLANLSRHYDPFIPPPQQYEKFNKKRRQWEDSGVLELIKLWKVCAYELRTIKRNGHLYVAMAKQLTSLGVPVTALEVHFKVNNLTQRYRQEQKTFETTGIISTWKFYSQVDDVFKSLAAHTGYKWVSNYIRYNMGYKRNFISNFS